MGKRPRKIKNCSAGQITVRDKILYVQNAYGDKEIVCGNVTAFAYVRTFNSTSVNVLVKFRDSNGEIQQIIVPKFECYSPGQLFERLVNEGWHVYNKKLASCVLSDLLKWSEPKAELHLVTEPGWQMIEGTQNAVFVLGSRVFSPPNTHHKIIGNAKTQLHLQSKGTLQDWQINVAPLFRGNSRQLLLLSAAFGAPLLYLIGNQNIGIQLHGAARSGKTVTALAVASTFGPSDFLESWKSTSNAILASALKHNDLIFPLDELSQAKVQDASEAAYDCMNGSAKARLNPNGNMANTKKFRVILVSTGEMSFSAFLENSGIRPTDGQLARMLSVPYSREGIFEDFHGCENASEFAAHFARQVNQYYGTSGPAFIEYLVKHQHAIRNLAQTRIEEIRKLLVTKLELDENSEFYIDVAKRFATLAFAGELAIEAKILPFCKGDMISAAKSCLADWYEADKLELANRDPLLTSLKAYIESSGSLRDMSEYENFDGTEMVFTHKHDGYKVYVFDRGFFESRFLAQQGKSFVIKILKEKGLLVLGHRGVPTVQLSLPKLKCRKSFYLIKASVTTTR